MLARLVINLTSDQLKQAENQAVHSVLTHGAWSPITTDSPALQSHFPLDRRRARSQEWTQSRERERVLGGTGRTRERGAKSFRGTALGVRHRERERGEEGGREWRGEETRAKLVRHAWHANDDSHTDRPATALPLSPSLFLSLSLTANKRS